MRNLIRSHKVYIPLLTIALSAGLFFIYHTFYVSWQRNYANERAFRLLSVAGDQLVQNRKNLKNIFAAALQENSHADEYLKRFLKDDISKINSPTCPPGQRREGELKLKLTDKADAGFVLEAMFEPAAKNSDCSLSGNVDLNTGLRERFGNVTSGYFDDMLIAASSGEVFFQKNLSGLQITNLNALLPPKVTENKAAKQDGVEEKKTGTQPTAFQDASQFSNVIDVTLAGTGYKLYLQPVPMAIASPKGQNLKLIVCGLWRTDRLQSEVVSIPYSVLNWGAIILLAIFGLAWPLLKVAYMSPSERLRRRHVFYLLVSTLFSTTMLTLIVLNWSYTERSNEESKEQLKALADRIESNVKTELGRALSFMDAVGKDEALHTELRELRKDEWKPATNFLQSKLFQKDIAHAYPYFDNMFWVDQDGQQQYKVTVRDKPTPRTSVKDESYFPDVLHEPHLKDVGEHPSPPDTKTHSGAKFRFDSVYSSNTGEFFAVLARHYPTPKEWTDLPSHKGLVAQVLVGRFLSLVDPILPAGFGYAVVSHDGMVQFHSSSARNQIEDFFKECPDPALKALVLNAGQDEYLHSNYMGKPQEMVVRPMSYLADPAPSLIVFRDTNYFGTINVACFLVFSLLACLFSVPFVVGLAIYVFRRREYPLEALWPDHKKLNQYVNVITANVCLIAAFAIRFQWMKTNETLVALIAITAAAVVFGTLKPKWANGEWTLLGKGMVLSAILAVSAWSWPLLAAGMYIALSVRPVSRTLDAFAERFVKLKYLYLGMVFSLLIVVVVAPCFGLFKISYDTVNRLALEAAQLKRRDRLIHRTEEINKYFRDLNAPEYVDDRIKESLDRYDEPVFDPKLDDSKYEAAEPDVSSLEPWIAAATQFFPSNPFGAELRQVATAFETGPGPKWASARDREWDDERLWLRPIPESVAPKGELVGVYPLWRLPWGAGALMALLAVLLAAWLAYLIRKVFMADLEDAPQLEKWIPATRESHNVLIIGHPMSGKSRQAASLPEVDLLDLAKVVTTCDWSLETLQCPAVVVDHFEFDIDNPDTCLKKLELLEQLVYVKKKKVILLSAVDPMFYLTSSSPEIVTPTVPNHESPGQLLNRWVAMLNVFEKLGMEDAGKHCSCWIPAEQEKLSQPELAETLENECGYTAQLRAIGLKMRGAPRPHGRISTAEAMEELLHRADSYYRVLLSTCSKEERLVLFQLATDGWANPKNKRAIQQLQRRRIIRRGSGFRIMNDSFSRFIRETECPGEVAKWEAEEDQSAWSAMKLGLTTAMLALGAWLLYTQQDVFQMGIGYVAAVGTAGGTILGLVRSIRGTGAPAKPG